MSVRFPSPPILDAPLPLGTPLHGNLLAVNIQMTRETWTLTYGGRVSSLQQRVIVQELFPPDCARVGRDVQPQGAPEPFVLARAGFLERARELRRVQHPNIAAARLSFAENNTAYLVTDRPGDNTLLERVRERGALEASEMLAWAHEIGGALETVHLSGLAHGGLHPGTVLLCPPENANESLRPVLADWGMERWLRRFAPDHQSVNDAFAPPEAELDVRGDIYSLGALLYYALTGLTPPSLSQRKGGRAPLAPSEANPEISRSVSDAILASLQLDPNARPQSIGEFLGSLSLARNVQVVAPPLLSAPLASFAPPTPVLPSPPPVPSVAPAPFAAPIPFEAPSTQGAPAAFDSYLPRATEPLVQRTRATKPLVAPLETRPERVVPVPVSPPLVTPPLVTPPLVTPPLVTPPLVTPNARPPISPSWIEPEAEWPAPGKSRLTGVLAGVLISALIIGVGVLVSLPRSEPPVEQVRAMAQLAATPTPTSDLLPSAPEPAPSLAPEVALPPPRPPVLPTSPMPMPAPTMPAPTMPAAPSDIASVPVSPPRPRKESANRKRRTMTGRRVTRDDLPENRVRDTARPAPKERRATRTRRLAERPASFAPDFRPRETSEAQSPTPRVRRRFRRETPSSAPFREFSPRERFHRYERRNERSRQGVRPPSEAGLPPAPSPEAGLPPSP